MTNDEWNDWQDRINSALNSDEEQEQLVDLFEEEMEKDE